MKGFIKNFFGSVLMFAPILSFTLGLKLYFSNDFKEVEKEKGKFLEEYRATAEYKEIEEDYLGTTYQLEDQNNQTEELIHKYGGENIKKEVSRLNEKIAELEKEGNKGRLIVAISSVMAIPMVLKGMNLVCEADLAHTEYTKKDEEDYLNKPVII